MAEYLGTMIFNWGRQGWSEVWYANKTDPTTALKSLEVVAQSRAGLLSAQVILEAIKVSDLTIRGDATLKSTAATIFSKESQTKGSDMVWSGWYARIEGGPMHRRQLFLRGMPDEWWKLSNLDNLALVGPPAETKKAFDAYIKTLKTEGWGLRVLDKSGANPVRPILSVVRVNPTQGDNHLQITFEGGGVAPGDTLRIYGGRSVPVLRGRHKVQSLTTGGAAILYTTSADPVVYAGDATFVKESFVLQPITNAVLLRPGKRDTGRAFFATRGRR